MDGAVPKGETINIVVKDVSGSEVQFKVKTTTKFEKIFAAYAQKKSLDVKSIKFLFDGQRVQDKMCPGDLDMEEGDAIDAMLEQLGGAAGNR